MALPLEDWGMASRSVRLCLSEVRTRTGTALPLQGLKRFAWSLRDGGSLKLAFRSFDGCTTRDRWRVLNLKKRLATSHSWDKVELADNAALN